MLPTHRTSCEPNRYLPGWNYCWQHKNANLLAIGNRGWQLGFPATCTGSSPSGMRSLFIHLSFTHSLISFIHLFIPSFIHSFYSFARRRYYVSHCPTPAAASYRGLSRVACRPYPSTAETAIIFGRETNSRLWADHIIVISLDIFAYTSFKTDSILTKFGGRFCLECPVRKSCIVVNETPSHSYGVSLAIWDHALLPSTRHKWTHPPQPQPEVGTRFTNTGGIEGWVDLDLGVQLHTEMVYSPADGHRFKQCTTGSRTRNLIITSSTH